MPRGKQEQILLPGKMLLRLRYNDVDNILVSNNVFICLFVCGCVYYITFTILLKAFGISDAVEVRVDHLKCPVCDQEIVCAIYTNIVY